MDYDKLSEVLMNHNPEVEWITEYYVELFHGRNYKCLASDFHSLSEAKAFVEQWATDNDCIVYEEKLTGKYQNADAAYSIRYKYRPYGDILIEHQRHGIETYKQV